MARVRCAVLRGSRDDAGFAATGAPPLLIDALSDLFLIPHAGTTRVAGMFVAGDATGALAAFGGLLKKHTLGRLGIEHAVMGSSLLEGAARKLLCIGDISLDTHQPYNAGGVAFFGTATDLASESLFLLGDSQHLKGAPYDFVKAALASSAFPGVFAPRRESELYPGVGARERRLSDGGMFDNLPFGPALKILADAQAYGAKLSAGKFDVVQDHLDHPDLFLVGAFDANPEDEETHSNLFEDLIEIRDRSVLLRNNGLGYGCVPAECCSAVVFPRSRAVSTVDVAGSSISTR
jgi:hypothetical protein